MKRRLLSIFMCLCMIMTFMPFSVFAADEGNVTNGYYDKTGAWHSGGNGTKSYTANDGTRLTLSKTAEDKGNNNFEITLQVIAERTKELTPPGAAATVLVIDVSGSMARCANCGTNTSRHARDCDKTTRQSRMDAAKTAAKNFLNSYKGDAAGSGRYVSIVIFSTDASVSQDWVDVSTTKGYNAAVSVIDSLSEGGGTNLEQGLYKANAQFSEDAVKSIEKAQHYVVALTDGTPTYYGNPAEGDGRLGSEETNSETAATAATLRGNSSVYTVCFGVADEYTWKGKSDNGPKVGEFLCDSIATPADGDKTYAYNASNATELYTAFAEISKSISKDIGSSGAGASVSDPMGNFVSADQVPENFVRGESAYNWTLGDVTAQESTSGGVTTYTYTYTLKYTVTLDTDAEGFDETVFHPANEPTVLNWAENESYEFPVPGLKGETSRYTVTYLKGDHGILNDKDASVKYENIKKWSDTVTADRPTPEVTADDGYYFIGWEPVIADKVTGKAVYTAQYAAQTEVVITGDSKTVDYNGSEQSITTYQVAGVDVAALSGISYIAKGTDAGNYEGKFSGTPVITIDGKDVTDQYKFTYKTGALVVNKLDVTLTSGSDSKTYDGKPLTKEEVTVSGDGFAAGEGASYSGFASITDKGSIDNTFRYILNDNTNADNYNIRVVYGKLNITPVTDTIMVIADSAEKVYDGQPLTKDSYSVEGKLAEGDELVAVVNGSITNVGSTDNVITSYKVMRGETDVTENYGSIVTVNGKLVVTQRAVVLTSGSDSKTYDGKPLTKEEVTVGGDGFAAGEGASYSGFASITDKGSIDNTFRYILNDNTNADNYNIRVVYGKLNITPVTDTIMVIADSAEKVYDGQPLTKDSYSVEGKLAEGDELVAVVNGSITNVGSTDNVITSYKVMRGETDVTENYGSIVTVNGKLVVTQRAVVLTSGSDSKTYDGKPLTKEEVTVSGDGFAAGEGASYSEFASITEKGSIDNTFSYILNDNTDADNYNITVINGELKVEAMGGVVVTVKENSGEFTYDGNEKTVEGYVVKSISSDLYTEDDFTFSGSAVVKGTIAGTYDMEVVPENFKNVNNNFKDVRFVVEDGQLVIKPIENAIVIKANDASKVYDGTALTDAGFSYTQGILADGDVLSAVVEGSQLDAGSGENVVTSYKVMHGDVDVTNCYTFGDSVNGLLQVSKRPVTLTSGTDSKTYDGKPLTKEEVTVGGDGFVKGEGASYSEFASITDKGSIDNTFKYTFNENTKPENYDVTVINGKLTIAPVGKVIVTITENSGEYTYDGTEKTVEGYTVSSSDPLYTEADFAFNGNAVVKGTVAGTYDMDLVPENFSNTNENFEEVLFVIVDGQLVIKPIAAEITITTNSAEKVYDGTALTDAGYSYTENVLVKGDVLTVDVVGSQTNAGSTANAVASYKVMRGDVDVTDCYTFAKCIEGTLTVTPKAVVITSGSASKEYDGKELTCDKVTAEGFVDGEGAEYKVTGSQTEVGSSKNTFEYTLNENTLAENYSITIVEGTLTVTPEKAPKTGDITNNALWAWLMAGSAVGIIGITALRKKEDEEA